MHINATGVVATTDVVEACKGVNIAVMVGGFPRKEGMERKDVMSKNVSIYKAQASALEQHAAADCKVGYKPLSHPLWSSILKIFGIMALFLHQNTCMNVLSNARSYSKLFQTKINFSV